MFWVSILCLILQYLLTFQFYIRINCCSYVYCCDNSFPEPEDWEAVHGGDKCNLDVQKCSRLNEDFWIWNGSIAQHTTLRQGCLTLGPKFPTLSTLFRLPVKTIYFFQYRLDSLAASQPSKPVVMHTRTASPSMRVCIHLLRAMILHFWYVNLASYVFTYNFRHLNPFITKPLFKSHNKVNILYFCVHFIR